MNRRPLTGAEMAAQDAEDDRNSPTGCRAMAIYFLVAVLFMLVFFVWMAWKVAHAPAS